MYFTRKTNITKPAYLYKMGRFCILLIYIFTSFITFAQLPKGKVLAENLEDQWQVLNEKTNILLPYIYDINSQTHSIIQTINVNEKHNYLLFLTVENESYLFWEGKYVKKIKQGSHTLNINKLIKNKEKPVNIFSLYSDMPFDKLPECYLVYNNYLPKITQNKNLQSFILKTKTFYHFDNFLVLLGVFLLVAITFVFNFQDKILQRYLSISDLFSFKKRIESTFTQSPFYLSNILAITILGLVLSLKFNLADFYLGGYLPKYLKVADNSLWAHTVQFFYVSVFIILSILLKYIYIQIVTNLFKLEKIANIHFFKNLQALSIVSVILLTIVFLFYKIPELKFLLNNQYYTSILLGFFILRVVILFFVLNRVIIANNLYLFSYLCIVEIVPILLVARLVL
jgi:hypothetical protein